MKILLKTLPLLLFLSTTLSLHLPHIELPHAPLPRSHIPPPDTLAHLPKRQITPTATCSGSFWCTIYSPSNFLTSALHTALIGSPFFKSKGTGPSAPISVPDSAGRVGPYRFNTRPLNSSALYPLGAHIICSPLDSTLWKGFCVFAEGRADGGGAEGSKDEGSVEGSKDEGSVAEVEGGHRVMVTGYEVKKGLAQMVEQGCDMCGSIALNTRPGVVLKADFVASRVCGGVCEEGQVGRMKG